MRISTGIVGAALAVAAGVAALPAPAQAWWARGSYGGYGGYGGPRYVVAPAPVYLPPPVVYLPAPRHVWVRAHWNRRGAWVPGHWA